MTGAELAERHRLCRVRGRAEWRGDCPACGYRAGLVLSEREGRAVWWCAGCHDRTVLTRALLGAAVNAWRSPRQRPTARPTFTSTEEAARRVRALWDAALALPGTLAGAYLGHRGVLAALGGFAPHAAGPALRFLPQCRCIEAGRDMPAMLAAVRDPLSGELRAVHRTFLAAPGRKAVLAAPKKSFGPIGQSAVLVHAPRPGQPLVVAEGIETALAASALLGAPAWAAVAASNLPALRLPDEVHDVIVAADPGDAGESAAEEATRRWRAEGRRVRIALPDDPKADFADLLLRRAAREVPHAG